MHKDVHKDAISTQASPQAEIPESNLVAELRRRWTAPAWRGRPALVHDDGTLSYGELAHRVAGIAGWLRAAGVRRGDFVGVAMARTPAQVMVLLGALAAGACPCPLEPRISAEETRRRVDAVGLAWMVYDAAHGDLAAACGLPATQLLDWERHDPDAAAGWDADVSPGDPALLLFTSGSTGRPKGVLLNHRGLLCNARGVAAHTGLRQDDRLLHVMPLHHTNAINNQVLAPLLAGAAIALGGRFRAEDMPGLMGRHAPTIITGVPTMYARMLELDFDRADLARLRFARCGSAPITEALHRRIEDFLGCPLIVSYGLSEATCTSTMNPPHARRIGTVGTVLPGQRVFLRRPDGGVAAPGAEGEICIAGDNLMTGYIGAADPGIADGILRTGDLGRFDPDGYLSITGRIKDVIIRGGENISPTVIERALAALPAVAACAVVGGPHADLGEVPVAFVVGRNGGAIDEAALRGEMLRVLGRIYVPERFIAVDALPENAVGKVDRSLLAARLRADHAGPA
ncbi:acid--CoA ligase [Bordetella sp. H567]|uniref:class I adenylate-forming enzyme family protein n=1 Tax=Bordetella sp. H567 TaxID=1697043 RepID=UPI00081CA407|nr:class I adenylate-forming enzyme family protein [Bordetella sp. H567]AOB33629.1 acid--CoA ligase [Bordetella sp. H567]